VEHRDRPLRQVPLAERVGMHDTGLVPWSTGSIQRTPCAWQASWPSDTLLRSTYVERVAAAARRTALLSVASTRRR
jgi:hypothetical protein